MGRGRPSVLFALCTIAGLLGCLPGGIINKGGHATDIFLTPMATRTRGAPYEIVCYDQLEADRREREARKKAAEEAQTEKPAGDKQPPKEDDHTSDGTQPSGKKSGIVLGPPVKYVKAGDYRGGCEEVGQHSMFFLFNVFPVTEPLNPEYAIGTAVQRLEGDTMINITVWHETHYYSLLGRVTVFKVRGDVIRFITPGLKPDKAEKKDKNNKKRRRRGGRR